MKKRSLLSMIFGNKNTEAPAKSEVIKFINGYEATFTPYKGDIQHDPDVLKCVDAIARNAAKMHPRHIKRFSNKIKYDSGNIYKLVAKQPNEVQNAYKFYYDIISNLELYNNAFIYIQRDEEYNISALYPLEYNECKFYEYKGKVFIKFKFGNSKERFVPYDNCIHLTRFTNNSIIGGSNIPIRKVLEMKHILDEGIVNAIKTTASIKGILKSTKSILKESDIRKMRDDFVNSFVDRDNASGIGGLDATTDFQSIKIEPTIASDSQIKEIDSKVLSYFGISENIIQSKYNEDEWNAFYESVLEPIGLQMSLEFSNKLFTPTEKAFGNEIIFESNRLQYASNKTKIEVIRYATNILTINEQREILNLAPIDGGDVFMIDQNHMMNDEINKNNKEENKDERD